MLMRSSKYTKHLKTMNICHLIFLQTYFIIQLSGSKIRESLVDILYNCKNITQQLTLDCHGMHLMHILYTNVLTTSDDRVEGHKHVKVALNKAMWRRNNKVFL